MTTLMMERSVAKTKLPKSVLGIKVPKALRKSKSVDTLLKSPTGREILAGALVAGATAAASALARHRPEKLENTSEAVVDGATSAAEAAKDATTEAASALAGSITSLLSRFHGDGTAKNQLKQAKRASKSQGSKPRRRDALETRSER